MCGKDNNMIKSKYSMIFNIVIQTIHNIKLALYVKELDPDSNCSLQDAVLAVYKDNIDEPIAYTTLIVAKASDRWTLYLSSDEMAEINLLGMSAKITRDFTGNVFATIQSPDFNSSFLVKEMIATNDVPF